jgi:hypothetical protein
MSLELNDEAKSTVENADSGSRPRAARGPWHRPQVTIIDLKRTLAALGAYTDGGTGSSF